MIRQLAQDLFRIKVRLHGPLRDLNSYVFLGKKRNLLIDTGFNEKLCLDDLQTGIRELGLDMARTDVLATHTHSDHCGLVGNIAAPDAKVYMSTVDGTSLAARFAHTRDYYAECGPRFLEDGFPKELWEYASKCNDAVAFDATVPHDLTFLNENDVVRVGERELRVINTPGHTPGHMCLYDEKEKLMVLGDHVLFDISPNITWWKAMDNALKSYLVSLRKIAQYSVEIPLPGHREVKGTTAERIEALFTHHRKRLDETREIIRRNPGISGYGIAQRLTWKIRAKGWDDFPVSQKWFAFGEALAHIDYLVAAGRVRREIEDGRAAYSIM
jgi:glyoxylase-like metal-dependent hydrolase (beta-lactamase superfamily II)